MRKTRSVKTILAPGILGGLIFAMSLLGACSSGTPAAETAAATTAATTGTEAVTSGETTQEAVSSEASGEKRVITDQYGFEVELPEKIERIAIHRLLPLPSVYAVYKGGNVDGLVSMPPDSLNAAKNSILARYAPDILDFSVDYWSN